MPNGVKYSTTQPTGGILKSNVALGLTGNLGPTGTTGWYNGITPASGKYVIYETSLEATPHIYTPQNDTELIRFANSKGAGGVSTVTGALQWFAGQSGYFATNIDYPGIVTDGLQCNLDVTTVGSYPNSGTDWFDLSGNTNNASLYIGSPTFSTFDNKRSIKFSNQNKVVYAGNHDGFLLNSNPNILPIANIISIE